MIQRTAAIIVWSEVHMGSCGRKKSAELWVRWSKGQRWRIVFGAGRSLLCEAQANSEGSGLDDQSTKNFVRVSASAKTQLHKDVDQVAAQSSLVDPSCEALG